MAAYPGGENMIRFLICDTDLDFAQRLAAAVHRLYEPCSVQYLYGPDALEAALRTDSGCGDILLTEVDLHGRSSVEIIGRSLKASSPLQVIYITSQIEHCTEVYDTRHSGFLLKPVAVDLFQKAVKRALRTLEQVKAACVVVHHGGAIRIVSAISLLYVEGSGRQVRLFTDEERLESYEKLNNIIKQMDGRFLQCHKSYVVNLDRVRSFHGDSFTMENGAKIPISQSKRKSVRERFLAYLGEMQKR